MKRILQALMVAVLALGIGAKAVLAITSTEAEALIKALNLNEAQTAAIRALVSSPGTVFDGTDSTCPNFSKVIMQGALGEDVVKLQTLLVSKGFLVIPAGGVKGTFGPKTKAALMAYQKAVGVDTNGIVDGATMQSLNKCTVNATSHTQTTQSSTNSSSKLRVDVTSNKDGVASIKVYVKNSNANDINYYTVKGNCSASVTATIGEGSNFCSTSTFAFKRENGAANAGDKFLGEVLVKNTSTTVGTFDISLDVYNTSGARITGDWISFPIAGKGQTLSDNTLSQNSSIAISQFGKIKLEIPENTHGKGYFNAIITGVNNPDLSYWKLSVKCSDALTLKNGAGSSVCGQSYTIKKTTYGNGSEEHVALTSDFTNTASNIGTIDITLDAYNQSGTYIGGDWTSFVVSGVNSLGNVTGNVDAAKPTPDSLHDMGVCPDGFSCASSGVNAVMSMKLLSTNTAKAGTWGVFRPFGYSNLNWQFTITPSVEKTIKRITIRHKTPGEVWSTGYSRYLTDGTDLYGYSNHPYPLVVTRVDSSGSETQLNSIYDANVATVAAGNTSTFKLYGMMEGGFAGGKAIVEFTDGTYASLNIPVTGDSSAAATTVTGASYSANNTTFVYPSAGASLEKGKSYRVSWTGGDAVSSYTVYLVGGGLGSSGSRALGTAYTANKYFTWTVPSDIASASNYQVQLSGAGASGGNSPSFSIVDSTLSASSLSTSIPVLSFLTPASGATLLKGTPVSISLTTNVATVGLTLRRATNDEFATTITSALQKSSGTTQVSWTPPSTLYDGDYYIQAYDTLNSSRTWKSGVFHITPATTVYASPSPTASPVYQTLLSPNGGEKLEKGKVYPIRWSSTKTGMTTTVYIRNLDTNAVVQTIPFANTQTSNSVDYGVASNAVRGSYKAELYVDGAKTDSSDNTFFITDPAPVITAISPLNPSQGTTVKLTGSFSESGNLVYLKDSSGPHPVTINSQTATSITVTMPSSWPNGTYGLVVENRDYIQSSPFSVTVTPSPSSSNTVSVVNGTDQSASVLDMIHQYFDAISR